MSIDSTGHKKASIIVVTYNSRADLEDSMPGLTGQSYAGYEIIVVDNNSADGTADFIKTNYPQVSLVRLNSNLGYATGNNIGFKESKGEYIVIVNPDVIVKDNWLEGLTKPLENDPRVAMSTSKIFEHDNPEYAACGNISHYTGLHFPRGFDKPAACFSKPELIESISGCSFAARRSVFEELGGFDPDYFLYLDDSDLSLRARIAGKKIVFNPDSELVHKHKAIISPAKEFFLEKNRYQLILKNYRWKVIMMILPGLLLTEIVTWGFAVLHGKDFIASKINAYFWIIKNLPGIMEKRNHVMTTYRISDKELFDHFQWKVPFSQLVTNAIFNKILSGTFNTFFGINYYFAKMLM